MASSQPLSNMPPRLHFNYDELDGCDCFLCVRYRAMAKVMARVRSLNGNGEMVGEMGRGYNPDSVSTWHYQGIHMGFMMASNKRDLYSELSFLTRNKKWAPEFLAWVLSKICDPTWQSIGWWANRCEVKSLGSWVADWYYETQGAGQYLEMVEDAGDL